MLVGVIHLPPLPGSPRVDRSMRQILEGVSKDARTLAASGYDAIIVENFGDAPFWDGAVEAVTVSAMTLCVQAARDAAPKLAMGVNVLRNDAESALSIAAVTGSSFIRVNIHSGARVTDQGTIQSRAAQTLRRRRALDAKHIGIWADVDVKHSVPLGAHQDVIQETHDVVERGLASAVLVTGSGTGHAPTAEALVPVRQAAGKALVLVASGATTENLATFVTSADGVIVGSALRPGGRAGLPIESVRAKAFARAFTKAFRR